MLPTGRVPPNLIHSVYAVEVGGTRFSVEVARGSPERGLEVNPDTELELEEEEPDPAASHGADPDLQRDDGSPTTTRRDPLAQVQF